MLKTIAYAAMTVVLIVLGITVKQVFFRDAGRTVQKETGQPVRTSSGVHLESATPSSSPFHELDSSDRAISADSRTSVPAAPYSSGSEFTNYSTMPAQQNSGGESQSPTPISADESEPHAVAGRPFPVSASLKDSCRRDLAKWGKQATCGEGLQRLSNMTQEPRDPTWATDTEARLSNYVMAKPDQFTIRAIECRLSLCAIEVASASGPYLGLDYRAEVNNKLAQVFGMHDYEVDPTSARVTVTLLMYERR